MSFQTKYFSVMTNADTTFAYQNLTAGSNPQSELLPKRVLVENNSAVKVFVKLMDKKSGDGPDDSVPITPGDAKSFDIDPKEDEPFYRVGVRLGSAGSAVPLDVSCSDYEGVQNVTY